PDARRELQRIGKEVRALPSAEADTNPLPERPVDAAPTVLLPGTEPLPPASPVVSHGGPRGTVRMAPFRDQLHDHRGAFSSYPEPPPVARGALVSSPSPSPAVVREAPPPPEQHRVRSGTRDVQAVRADLAPAARSRPAPAWAGPF